MKKPKIETPIVPNTERYYTEMPAFIISPEEQELFKKYRLLNESDRKKVRDLIDNLLV